MVRTGREFMAKKRERLKAPLPLGQVLTGRVWGNNGARLVDLFHVQRAWTDAVGEQLAQRTYPNRIRGGTLYVTAENPAW